MLSPWLIKNLSCIKYLLMTAVPLPGTSWPIRHEISCALILHPLGESQQDPHIIVGGLGAICRAEQRHIHQDKNKQ